MRIAYAHVAKRQATALPSASGLGAVQTASIANAGSALLLGSNTASSVASITAGLVAGVTGVVTVTSTPTAAATTAVSMDSSSISASSSFSTGGIIGIIIAAFACLVLCIFLVYGCLRRRWAKALEARPRRPANASPARNMPGEDARRRSRLQPWSKLDSDRDTWEAMEKKPGSESGENNRLSLFRKASSTRSGTEEKSTAPHEFDPSTMPNFAQYHPDLAAELASAPGPPVLPFVTAAHQDARSSTGAETASGDSFLTLRMSDTSGMSPGSAALKTPVTVTSALHHWQSAEVLTMDVADVNADAAEPVANPFADEVSVEHRTAGGGANPFFSAHPSSRNPFADPQRRPTISRVPLHAHKDSADTVDTVDSADTVRAGPARPDSGTRPDSSSHAMQSLLAALDAEGGTGAGVDQRASLQPSVVSSQYAQTERASMASFVTYTPKAM